MEPVLEIIGLEKHFLGCHALRGVDMAVPAGQIAGLLGPNASGKTTLLKAVAGLLQPSAGQVRYGGGAAPGPGARAAVGFCPDAMGFPRWMRVKDAFDFYRDMYPDYSQARAMPQPPTLSPLRSSPTSWNTSLSRSPAAF